MKKLMISSFVLCISVFASVSLQSMQPKSCKTFPVKRMSYFSCWLEQPNYYSAEKRRKEQKEEREKLLKESKNILSTNQMMQGENQLKLKSQESIKTFIASIKDEKTLNLIKPLYPITQITELSLLSDKNSYWNRVKEAYTKIRETGYYANERMAFEKCFVLLEKVYNIERELFSFKQEVALYNKALSTLNEEITNSASFIYNQYQHICQPSPYDISRYDYYQTMSNISFITLKGMSVYSSIIQV